MHEFTVHGAGIMGLMCAWMLRQRGAAVQVIDPHGPGAGASGGLVGALAPHVPENWNPKKAMQFRALDRAAHLWADIAEASQCDPGYARTGRLQPVLDDGGLALAKARSAGATTFWEGRYEWRLIRAEDAPVAVTSPTGWLILDSLTARIHPRRACHALAGALRAKDVPILPQAEPRGIEIWATGATDLDVISAQLGRLVGMPIKGQAALMRADLATAPQIFADGLHIVPHADGTVAIGSTTEREFADPHSTDDRLDPLIAKARAVCPRLMEAPVVERWAGLRPRARSRAPMVGAHPIRPGAYIANGGFKIGFAMAPVVAEMLTSLLLDGVDTIPPEFKPEASL